MEDFVTYEQAQKLCDFGFNFKCISKYNEDHEFVIAMKFRDFNNRNSNDISAPTLAQAQKWIREVKGIAILVNIATNTETNITKKVFYFKWFNSDFIFCGVSKYHYATYEQALSSGIDKALKLLKQ